MAESDLKKYVVAKPAYEVVPKFEVNNRIPAMTLMSGNLVPGEYTVNISHFQATTGQPVPAMVKVKSGCTGSVVRTCTTADCVPALVGV